MISRTVSGHCPSSACSTGVFMSNVNISRVKTLSYHTASYEERCSPYRVSCTLPKNMVWKMPPAVLIISLPTVTEKNYRHLKFIMSMVKSQCQLIAEGFGCKLLHPEVLHMLHVLSHVPVWCSLIQRFWCLQLVPDKSQSSSGATGS